MVGASKILTVSYGTFSCTLEGFDDPFTAMKAIAEYFRELAADDRFFGAEPPTPDTEMLHRIAEREVQRRVEAEVSEHGVVLRAKPDEPPALSEAPDAPHSAPAAESSNETESIAAKLMRIRAVVAASRTAAETARHTAPDPTPEDALAEDASDLADDFRFGLDLDRDESEQKAGLADFETTRTANPAFEDVMDDPADEADKVTADEPSDEAGETVAEAFAEEPMNEAEEAIAEETADEPVVAVGEAIAEEMADESLDEIEDARAEEVTDEPMDAAEEAVAEEITGESLDAPEEAVAEEAAAESMDETVEAFAEETVDDPVEAIEEAVADETTGESLDAVEETLADEIADEPMDVAEAFTDEPMDETVKALVEETVDEPMDVAEEIADKSTGETEEIVAEEFTNESMDVAEEAAAEETADEPMDAVEEALADTTADEPLDETEEAIAEEIADEPMDAVEDALAEDPMVETLEARVDEITEDIADDPADEVMEAFAAEVADAPVDEVMEAAAEETAEDPTDEALDAIAEKTAEDFEDDAVDAVAEGVAEDPADAETAEEPEAAEGALDLAAWRTDDPLPPEIPEYDPDLEDDWTPVSGARARVIKIHRSPAAAAPPVPPSPAAEEAAPQETAQQEEETDRSAIFAALADDNTAAEVDEEPQNEEMEAGDDATLLAGIDAAIGGGAADAEDDLARELAALAREARRDAHEGRAILESTSDDDGASVERLMEEAKSKLEGVENRRRFSAISHLKAAVAATVADRKLASSDISHPQDADDADTDMNRYRDDLSKAVRPHRPETDGPATTPRPKTRGTASPLVLVTEQRVDDASRQPEEVVRPRRISADTFMRDDDDDYDLGDDAPISRDDAKNFAEFAERLGATSLPELLEAAAAYTATVEGQPHFSRPQILRKVAHVAEKTDFSREDGLRSFGMLLREGKIQKISRGQFTITETSKFLAEEKTASR